MKREEGKYVGLYALTDKLCPKCSTDDEKVTLIQGLKYIIDPDDLERRYFIVGEPVCEECGKLPGELQLSHSAFSGPLCNYYLTPKEYEEVAKEIAQVIEDDVYPVISTFFDRISETLQSNIEKSIARTIRTTFRKEFVSKTTKSKDKK